MRSVIPVLVVLSACAPQPAASPPPSTSTVELPLRLVGTEPFWGVLLEEGSLSFSGVDRGAIVAPIASRRVEGGRTVFRTSPPSRERPVAVVAAVTPGACSDGMSDRFYPYSARVDIDYAGASPPVTLTGCAGPEGLFQQEPRP